jgi:hypothetical protein
MPVARIVGLLLIAAGVLALVYGQLTYTKKTHEANVAGIELALKEKESVKIPKWAGAGSVAVGALLLLVGRRK